VGEDEVRLGIVEGEGNYCPFLFVVCFWGQKNLLYMENRRFQEFIRLYLALFERVMGFEPTTYSKLLKPIPGCVIDPG
jgi:hypothetical protein